MPLGSLSLSLDVNRSVCGARVLRVRLTAYLRHAPGVRARLRAVGQAPLAGLVLEEVGVRHVERHSRLRSPDVLLRKLIPRFLPKERNRAKVQPAPRP